MNKVLFVTGNYFSTPSNGKEVVLSGLYSFFKKKGWKVTVLAINSEGNGHDNESADFIFSRPPNASRIVFNILFFSLLRRSKSLQECFFFSKRNLIDLTRVFAAIKPDLVVFDTLRCAQYLERDSKFSGARCVVYLDDLFSVRYSRMLDSIDQGHEVNALGNFAKRIPYVFRPIASKLLGVQRYLLELERRLIWIREVKAVDTADRVLLISPSEVDHLKQSVVDRKLADRIAELPPRLGGHPIQRNWDGSRSAIFLGSMNLAHNEVGIYNFIIECLPKVLMEIPDFQLTIVGRFASDRLLTAVEKVSSNVRILGYVDDLKILLSTAGVMIAPLLFGSGIKLKMIDAFSAGLPIISTSFGVEGIEFADGIHGRVADNWDCFAKSVIEVLDENVNWVMSSECSKLFEYKYSNDEVEKVYEGLFFGETKYD